MKVKILFLIVLILTSCSSSGTYQKSDHFDGKVFFNPSGMGPNGFLDLLKWKLSFNSESWPNQALESVVPASTLALNYSDKMVVTFIGHATFLIQIDGINILTDPIWSERASPFSFVGPKRVNSPGINFDKLPPIDLVLISHNHYDHMDEATLRDLEKKFSPLFLVPLNNAHKMKSFGAKKVEELDWWNDKKITSDITITLTPAEHWSSRTPFDRNEALWGSFYIKGKKEKVYFAGDTGYAKHFKDIKKALGAPTLSILPIGAYEPRWFMKSVHLNPEDALLAHLDLESKLSLGMHFMTFKLTDEAIDTPEKDLELAKIKLKIDNFKTPKIGETFFFE